MKKKYTKRNYEYDLDNLEKLNREFGMPEAGFLFEKFGVTPQNAKAFFAYDTSTLHDPFLLDDMKDVVELINNIVNSNGKILIFGDYDADGISATAMLKLFFESLNVECDAFLPKRNDGYGLNIKSFDGLFKKSSYDLVITVDCGITGIEEVKYVKEVFGCEIVVTDHHEIYDRLPECLCINPKRGYPMTELSGSAVAFKLIQALIGIKDALYYADLAAIGIIGDLMPLTDENRVLVKHGLKNINNIGLKALLALNRIENPECNDFALKVCPKLNAAGRVGNPKSALELLVCPDTIEVKKLAIKLSEANEARKLLSEETFEQALAMIVGQKVDVNKAIFLCNENWQHGMLGIVCNKLVEKFNVPIGVFTVENDNIVGSLRTVRGDNLFETVSSISDTTLRFGGHKASVGVTLEMDKFNDFCSAFWNATSKKDFFDNTSIVYDEEFQSYYKTDKFFNQLASFQPIMPNDRVVFYGNFTAKDVSYIGKEKKHIKIITDGGVELKGFYNYAKFYSILNTGCRFECTMCPSHDDYSNSMVFVLESLSVLPSVSFDNIYLQNYLTRIRHNSKNKHKLISADAVPQLLEKGKCCIVFNSYEEFQNSQLSNHLNECIVDFFFPSLQNSLVLISPNSKTDFSHYLNVVFCNNYDKLETFPKEANVFVVDELSKAPAFLFRLNITRDICALVYKSLSASKQNYFSLPEAYDKLALYEISFEQFIVTLEIFKELGLVEINDYPFHIKIKKDTKVDLNNSSFYKLVAK